MVVNVGMKMIIPILGLTLSITFNAYGNTNEYHWVEKKNGIQSEWYYMDGEGDRWIQDFGYWYYIDKNHKMLTESKDKNYLFNDGSNKEMPYGALIEDNQVLYKEKQLSNCSYLEIKREGLKEVNRVVVMLHGLGGVKENYISYGTELASRGALVIVPELYGHEKDKVGDIPNIIVNTSDNIERILKSYKLKGDYELDIIGCSLGGMIGAYFTENSGYKVAKLSMLISTVSFIDLENEIFFKKYSNTFDNGEADKERVLDELKRIDINNLNGTEVRMYNTVNDHYMDYTKIKNKVDKLIGEGNNITWVKMNYSGHSVTNAEYMEVIDWICKESEQAL